MDTIYASQLQIWSSNHDLGLLSMWSFASSPHVQLKSLQVLWFPPISQKHASKVTSALRCEWVYDYVYTYPEMTTFTTSCHNLIENYIHSWNTTNLPYITFQDTYLANIILPPSNIYFTIAWFYVRSFSTTYQHKELKGS